MPHRRTSPFEKIIGRVDDLDEVNLGILVQRLARERRLLETVLNTIPEGIMVITSLGLVEYSNAAASTMIGFSMEEVGRAVLWKLVPELARTMDLTVGGELSGVTIVSREMELNYPEYRFVRIYFVPLPEGPEQADDPQRFVVILADVTRERLSAEEEIRSERESSIVLLAAGVAHELGNPLNSLNIHLQLMQRRMRHMDVFPGADKFERSLRICVDEVERLDGIITNFLEAIRPVSPDFQDLDLIEVLEEVLDLQSEEFEGRGVSVEIDLKASLPLICGDRNQIKQVFFNVLKNAQEAMEAGGVINVHGRSDDEYTYLLIGDKGEGIEEENLARVFHPYYTTKKGGHGLGMMIVQRIMRIHGGQAGIDSRASVGTVVTLQFPLKQRRIRMLQNGV